VNATRAVNITISFFFMDIGIFSFPTKASPLKL